MHAGVMGNRYLDHSETGQFELLGHFDANDAASGFQGNTIEDIPAEKPEIAIHVAYRKPEYPSHRAPVHGADPDAIPSIRAFDFVSIDEIDVRFEVRQKVV